MKNKHIIILIILILISVFFVGCNGQGDKPIRTIAVQPGSIKVNFAIDEEIDLSNATIIVNYWDGSNQTLPITRDMISDFDTRQTLTNGQMTITYQDKTDRLFYTVGNNEHIIRTNARMLIDKKEGNLTFSLNHLEEFDLGIYAASFFIEIEDLEFLGDFTVLNSANGDRISKEIKENGIKVLYYNEEAIPLYQDRDFLKIEILPTENEVILKLKDIEISDGETIVRLPDKQQIL